jgi:hypothetical protein
MLGSAAPVSAGLTGREASLSATARSAGDRESLSSARLRSARVASGRSLALVVGESAFWARARAAFARQVRLCCLVTVLVCPAAAREEGLAARAGVLSVVATSATTLASSTEAVARRARVESGMGSPSLSGESTRSA